MQLYHMIKKYVESVNHFLEWTDSLKRIRLASAVYKSVFDYSCRSFLHVNVVNNLLWSFALGWTADARSQQLFLCLCLFLMLLCPSRSKICCCFPRTSTSVSKLTNTAGKQQSMWTITVKAWVRSTAVNVFVLFLHLFFKFILMWEYWMHGESCRLWGLFSLVILVFKGTLPWL